MSPTDETFIKNLEDHDPKSSISKLKWIKQALKYRSCKFKEWINLQAYYDPLMLFTLYHPFFQESPTILTPFFTITLSFSALSFTISLSSPAIDLLLCGFKWVSEWSWRLYIGNCFLNRKKSRVFYRWELWESRLHRFWLTNFHVCCGRYYLLLVPW